LEVDLELVKFHSEERVQWIKVYLDTLAFFFLWPCGTLQYLLCRSYSRYDFLWLQLLAIANGINFTRLA